MAGSAATGTATRSRTSGAAAGTAVTDTTTELPATGTRPDAEHAGDLTAGPSHGRVRVVLSERKGIARPVRNVVELQESGTVGDLLRGNLIGSQLRVALVFALIAAVVLGTLPLVFWWLPILGHVDVFGLRLPWLVLGLAVYPFLFALGAAFTRTAERVEQNFADQVQD